MENEKQALTMTEERAEIQRLREQAEKLAELIRSIAEFLPRNRMTYRLRREEEEVGYDPATRA